MGPGDTRWRLLGLVCTLTVGGLGVYQARTTGDWAMAAIAVGFVVVVLLLGGPVLRWLRRGEGPRATRGASDDGREEYLRLRHDGGSSTGH